jgi:hypothetical protein
MATTVTLELRPEVEAGLLAQAQASGLSLEAYVEQVLQERSRGAVDESVDSSIAAAARRLATFGKRHGLSLGGTSIRELLNESRP